MKFLIVTAILVALLSPSSVSGGRLYIRHRRAAPTLEREGVPAKESTVVVASDSNSDSSAAADLPDDLKPHVKKNEKDCKDFFELDYNPQRDMFMFNGQVPNIFRPFRRNSNDSENPHDQGMHNIQNLFQQMFQHASHMFNGLPGGPMGPPMINQNFPDNYNGTTEEIIDIDGQKFVKKQHIINKNVDGVQVHLISTSYEPANKEEPEADKEDDKKEVDKKATGEEDIPIKENESPKEETTKKPNDLTDGTVVQY